MSRAGRLAQRAAQGAVVGAEWDAWAVDVEVGGESGGRAGVGRRVGSWRRLGRGRWETAELPIATQAVCRRDAGEAACANHKTALALTTTCPPPTPFSFFRPPLSLSFTAGRPSLCAGRRLRSCLTDPTHKPPRQTRRCPSTEGASQAWISLTARSPLSTSTPTSSSMAASPLISSATRQSAVVFRASSAPPQVLPLPSLPSCPARWARSSTTG